MLKKVFHELPPIYNENSKILILGSMPSVKSREIRFYYGHPKNRFWNILEVIFNQNIINLPVINLPSTSPANCRKKSEELIEEYKIIKTYIK